LERNRAGHLTLIDPDKQRPEDAARIASAAERAGSDGIMVGGSTGAGGRVLDRTVREIKKAVGLPVILFPGDESGISKYADAIFFMSMLNSRNPRYLSRAQMFGAPVVKKYGLEPLPMAYLVVEPGGTVGRVGDAELIPRSRPDIAAAYALAGMYMGMRFVYLEAGSGARYPVPVPMVRAVRKAVDSVLIVGGGIRKPASAAERVRAGADFIVTGTLVEQTQSVEEELRKLIRAIKRAAGRRGRSLT
jgi:phosphoglycerol geranylgeranyltransferase